MRNTIHTPNAGIPCDKCGEVSDLQEHKEITEKLKKQPFYYSQWYYCRNEKCARTVFMRTEDKVLNHNEKSTYFKNKEERAEQVSFFKGL